MARYDIGGEYTGKVPRQQFRDFYPEKKIGQTPLRPDFDKRVVVTGKGESALVSAHFSLPKCALGSDWDGSKLFALADATRRIEGRELPTVLHAFTFAVNEVMDALNLLYPELPAAAMAEFCESYDVWRHLCCFARALERYGPRLGWSPGLRDPGLWEDEIHRALRSIWEQLADYASKLRLEVALGPAAPQGTVTIPEPAVETPIPTPSNPEASPRPASKRGAKGITDEEACAVDDIVQRVAPDGNLRPKLPELRFALDHGVCNSSDPECEAEDHQKIPLPRGWATNGHDWFNPPDNQTLVKAIKERLRRAKRTRGKFSTQIPA
jgi:hypothetical protein